MWWCWVEWWICWWVVWWCRIEGWRLWIIVRWCGWEWWRSWRVVWICRWIFRWGEIECWRCWWISRWSGFMIVIIEWWGSIWWGIERWSCFVKWWWWYIWWCGWVDIWRVWIVFRSSRWYVISVLRVLFEFKVWEIVWFVIIVVCKWSKCCGFFFEWDILVLYGRVVVVWCYCDLFRGYFVFDLCS